MFGLFAAPAVQDTSMRRGVGALALLGSLLLSGCATPGRTSGADPWIDANRGVYKFNDELDKAAVKPVAQAYKKITPIWFRAGTGRFFSNLGYPVTIVNQLLQGKPLLFLQDTGRLLTNSTLGLGGAFDVADRMGMPAHNEDFGQTLAVWGVPSGPYVMLPVLGPSTTRDAPGLIPEFFTGVLGLADAPFGTKFAARALQLVDTRATLLSAEGALEDANDKYVFVRDAWIQRREYLIFDGDPPVETFEEEATEDPAQETDAAAPATSEAEKAAE
jgi:phospholipid-binding lipoprotein MlaA